MKIKTALALSVLMVSLPVRADIGAFVGVGAGFAFPGTIRVEFGEWEAGLLTPASYGFAKVFESGNWYSALGPIVAPSPKLGFGFYGAVGGRWRFLKIFALRGELAMIGAHTGLVKGEGVAGLELRF